MLAGSLRWEALPQTLHIHHNLWLEGGGSTNYKETFELIQLVFEMCIYIEVTYANSQLWDWVNGWTEGFLICHCLLACVCGCKDWTQKCIGFFFFLNLPNQPLSNISWYVNKGLFYIENLFSMSSSSNGTSFPCKRQVGACVTYQSKKDLKCWRSLWKNQSKKN